MVSPVFDLLFFANIYWVLAFFPFYTSPEGEPYIQFWMAYFLATPHRWLTLVVAATDRERRYGQTWLFVTVGALFAVLIAAVLWTTGDFRSLFLFYTLVLGWHFATQHQLVLNIYAGLAGERSSPAVRWIKQHLPLAFFLYTNVRLIAFLEPVVRLPSLDVLRVADRLMLAIPVALVGLELAEFTWERLPKLVFLTSVLSLWSSVLWTAHTHQDALCSVLLGAVTVFHSVEYLALVSCYARGRRELGSHSLFQTMARHWCWVIAWYVVGSGVLYTLGNVFFVTATYAVNTWASLVHCAYDGLMWRIRNPQTAKAFGLDSTRD